MIQKRRQLLLALSGLVASPSLVLSKQLVSTPSQSAGPFYPLELPLDNDNDLTLVEGNAQRAKGEITDLTGKIVDINGKPLSNMRIEIWQCDYNGRYRHPYENGSKPIDPNFQGHGFTTTNAEGDYRFRTIKPVAYPGRTPHIHVAVFPKGDRPFVTQLYVKDEAANQNDFLFTHIPEEKRHLVLAEFTRAGEKGGETKASFDIILNRENGTPLDVS